MKILINETQCRNLIESYKVTLDDKKKIDDEVRERYEDYLKDYQSTLQDIKINQIMIDTLKGESEDIMNHFKYLVNAAKEKLSDIKSKKHDGPMLYNEFYDINYPRISKEYINSETRRVRTVAFKGLDEKVLDPVMVEQYYNTLNENEIKSIKRFLKIVAIRQDSGTGESVDRGDVRDAFFNTPVGFQKMYSVKPSKFYWRGDDVHPCDVDYESDPDYLKMQSFSNSKTYDFGVIRFPSTRIGSYGGSFSLPLYIEYGFESINLMFGDDEGEIMFFDVTYKCNKKFSRD